MLVGFSFEGMNNYLPGHQTSAFLGACLYIHVVIDDADDGYQSAVDGILFILVK